MHCGPLSWIVDSLHLPRIDFWSLDVEDAEESVLRTFDFARTPVRYLMVEVDNRFFNDTKREWLEHTFAPAHNFELVRKIGASLLFRRDS